MLQNSVMNQMAPPAERDIRGERFMIREEMKSKSSRIIITLREGSMYQPSYQGSSSWLGRITQGRALCVQRALPKQLAGSNYSHAEQDRALCVLERALPTELLRQLSWLGRITHTQSKAEHSVF